MKEVLTKSFWQGVRKTYYEALEGPPPKGSASLAPAERNLNPLQCQRLHRRHHLRASGTDLALSPNGACLRIIGELLAAWKECQKYNANAYDQMPDHRTIGGDRNFHGRCVVR
jgi:hypothetical protein